MKRADWSQGAGMRIGITQRRTAAAPGSLARDCLDAGWADWFALELAHACFVPIPNFSDPVRAVAMCDAFGLNAFVLSGGEDVGQSPQRDAVEERLLAIARAAGHPVLGVCRGMQMLHRSTGGTLEQIPGHVGMPHPVDHAGGSQLVNSWHRWAVTVPGAEWDVLATAQDDSVEAMQHKALPWTAVMWHPERSDGSTSLVRQWLLGSGAS
jgi:putative glutamine amidotransferase